MSLTSQDTSLTHTISLALANDLRVSSLLFVTFVGAVISILIVVMVRTNMSQNESTEGGDGREKEYIVVDESVTGGDANLSAMTALADNSSASLLANQESLSRRSQVSPSPFHCPVLYLLRSLPITCT